MFRFREKASKEVPLTEKLKEMNPVLQVDGNPDLAMQLKLTNMTKEDLAVARCLKPYIEENIQEIMEKYYDNIEQNPDLRSIINKHSSTDKLKKTLRRHITEMFSGILNKEFMEKRKKLLLSICISVSHKNGISHPFLPFLNLLQMSFIKISPCRRIRHWRSGFVI